MEIIEIEELKDEKDLVRKDQLLQKYGIIPPKLTEIEKLSIIHTEGLRKMGAE